MPRSDLLLVVLHKFILIIMLTSVFNTLVNEYNYFLCKSYFFWFFKQYVKDTFFEEILKTSVNIFLIFKYKSSLFKTLYDLYADLNVYFV